MDGPSERLIGSTPTQAAPPKPKRRQSRVLSFIRGLFGLIFAIGVVGAGAVGLVGWNLYDRYLTPQIYRRWMDCARISRR